MKLAVRKTKTGLSFRVKASNDEGADLKDAVMACAEGGMSPTILIDRLREIGYEATSFRQRGENYLAVDLGIPKIAQTVPKAAE